MKILVAEDDKPSLGLLLQFFTGRGHEVWIATNGREALTLCRERGLPDVIVSDALMPQLDGFELCATLRGDPALCPVPFILYTATYTSENDERFTLAVGADRFLVKPTEPAALMEIIHQVVADVRARPPRQPRGAEASVVLVQEHVRMLSIKLEEKLAELTRANAALRGSEETVRQLNRDLTETILQLKSECEDRRRTSELLGMAQAAGGIGTWEVDPAGNLTWSEAARQILRGTGLADTSSVAALVHGLSPDQRQSVEVLLRQGLTGSPGLDVEFDISGRDDPDAARCFALRGHRLSDTHRVIGVLQEVTARKQAEARRQTLERQLLSAQKMEALGQLAGGIAHDFNNMLTAILGHSELLQIELETLAVPPSARESLNQVVKAGRQAQAIVGQILVFSRKQSVQRRNICLATVIEESLQLVRATIGKTIAIKCALDPKTHVLANENQIQQIMLNLCTNAAHAMEDREGELTVTLTAFELGPLDAEARPGLRPGPYARLQVSDNGTGIAPAVLERIFEPFFTTKPMGEGTGLGLAVVHGIVQSHEGSIEVASEPEHGTTFTLLFPAITACREDPAANAPKALATGQGQHILVVDDEPSVAKTCAQMLGRIGYRVTTLTDPLEAEALFQRSPADFSGAVIDYMMPRLSGLELAKRLRAVRNDFPIVLVTGFGVHINPARIEAEKLSGMLAKPYTLNGLAEAVARAVRPAPEA